MSGCIVVPIDLSEPSLVALKVAASLAKKTRSKIEAVFAVSATRVRPSGQKPAVSAGLVGDLTAEAKESLLEALASLDKSVDVQGVVREGPPAEVIEAYADEREASLLVMGTHGRTGVGRLVLGSVAERVIRTVDTPTLVVPTQYDGVPGGPIVVAYDFSENAQRALRTAASFARTLETKLHVVHVYTDPFAEQRAYREAKGQQLQYQDVRERALEVGMNQLLREELLQLPEGREVENAVVRKGVSVDELTKYADEVGAAAIALGSTGRAGAARALVGSTTQHVLRTAKRPIFVVH